MNSQRSTRNTRYLPATHGPYNNKCFGLVLIVRPRVAAIAVFFVFASQALKICLSPSRCGNCRVCVQVAVIAFLLVHCDWPLSILFYFLYEGSSSIKPQ